MTPEEIYRDVNQSSEKKDQNKMSDFDTYIQSNNQ